MGKYALLGPYLSLRVLGIPVPQGSVRHFGKGRPSVHGNQAKLLPWRDHVQFATEEEINHIRARNGGEAPFPLDGAVGLATYFTLAKPTGRPKTKVTYPTARPDTSHLIRAVEDALTAAGVYKDDSRIVWTEAIKCYPGEEMRALHVPGVIIEVYGITTVNDS